MDNTICAACGKGGDSLKTCTACKAVKYCSVSCQKQHRQNHKKECKKRAAELFDEALFKQPPPKEDCPICFLTMPHRSQQSYMSCCATTICAGCDFANRVVRSNETCPFCRKGGAGDDEEYIKRIKLRIASNDAEAMYLLGCHYANGDMGLPQDSNKAMELWFQAAELGSNAAHCALGKSYYRGEGVEMDMKKSKYHLEIAAMAGDEDARYNLGALEAEIGNINRAIKHWMIAATAGEDLSMKAIKEALGHGHVTKDEYEKTLRGFIVSVKETRSEDRDNAAAALKTYFVKAVTSGDRDEAAAASSGSGRFHVLSTDHL